MSCSFSRAATLVAAVFLFPLPSSFAGDETSSVLAETGIRLDVTKHVLSNGMRFLIVPWGDAPVVATLIRFDVGGVDDPKGLTGVAHLLEHMMFKGTTTIGTTDWAAEKPVLEKLNALWRQYDRARADGADAKTLESLAAEIAVTKKEHEKFVVKNEVWQIYDRCGGTGLNASTDNDATQYTVTLPSNQLAVWARVESDRIAHPVFREFYSERDVVHEERRLRVDSQPRGIFSELFDTHAFLVHPYREPVVGWPQDIDATADDEVLEYFKTYYAPNNAVAVLVGDVDPAQVIPLVEKWFSPIPPHALPRRRITPEPEQLGERRFSVKLDAPTALTIAWHAPGKDDPDAAALQVATRILNGSGGGFGRGGGGGSSVTSGRFRKKLVDEMKVARRANSGVQFGRYPGLFTVNATPGRGKTTAELETAVYAEMARLVSEPPSEAELGRVRTAIQSQAVRGLGSASGIARALASAEVESGDWRQIEKDREAWLAVTAEDVARVAKKYFTVENRVVGVLDGVEEEDEDEEPPPGAPVPPAPTPPNPAPAPGPTTPTGGGK